MMVSSEEDWDVATGIRANATDIECPFVTEASLSFTSLFGEDHKNTWDSLEFIDDFDNTTTPLKKEGSPRSMAESGNSTVFNSIPSSSSFWRNKVLFAGFAVATALFIGNAFRKG